MAYNIERRRRIRKLEAQRDELIEKKEAAEKKLRQVRQTLKEERGKK